MPGNGVGDRVHNFFAQDNLSQGLNSQVVDGNWLSNNNLLVGSQKQFGFQSSNPKSYNPQLEIERGDHSQNAPVPHNFSFTQATARGEFADGQFQNQQPNLNGYMYGRQVFQTRPADEANFLGVNTESDRNNVNQRGISLMRHEGVSEQITKNSVRTDNSDAPGSFDLFGGQHQMNSQYAGMLQPLQQQQSGFSDIQHLEQQLMLRKMQELQRQKGLLQLDARQDNSVNQVSPFAKSQSNGLINGSQTSDSSSYPWPEATTGNTNWLQRASPTVQGSSSGLVFSPEQGQAQHSMGFVHQSLYGVPVSSSVGPLNQYPHIAIDKASIQQLPTYNYSFPGNQYSVIPEQVSLQDGASVSRQGLPGKSLFGHTSGQGPNSWIKMENIQQRRPMQQNTSVHQFQGPQDLIVPSETVQEKSAMETTSSHGADSLDPDEEKILFGSDGNIWDAFGSDKNTDGGASNLLDANEFESGLPSIHSGSWSALMQSAVAEASSSGIGLQEEWTGLNVQNPEIPSARSPTPYEDSGKQQKALGTSTLGFGSFPLADGASRNDKHHVNLGFWHHGKNNPYEHDEIQDNNSYRQMNQHSSGGSNWLNRVQKEGDVGSQPYEDASNSVGGEIDAKKIPGHWTSQQYGTSQSNNKQVIWNTTKSIPTHGDTRLNINENDKALQQSQSNEEKRVMHEEMGQGVNPQINKEGFGVNIALANRSSQFPPKNHHPNYWKHVDYSVKSTGSENSGKSHRQLNKGPQVSESSLNSSDKEDLKMHEIDSNSRGEKFSSDAGDLRSLPGMKQNLSFQAGGKTSGSRKFQYHPMGNLDEDVETPYRTRQGTNTQVMSVLHSQRIKGQDQGVSGQVSGSSAVAGKGHLPDFGGVTKGSDDMQFQGMIPGQMPNMFASFDRSAGLATSATASQPSQNMLELLHKVDQSRDRGIVNHLNSSERNSSSEMHEPENSDGSFGVLQRSQSSNSQGFGLQLGPPSQRLPLPNHTSPSAIQAINSNPLTRVQVSPFQETSYGEFKNDRNANSGPSAGKTSMPNIRANFPNSRSQLQNHQMIGARGQALTDHSANESFNGHTPPNAAITGLYENAASGHVRVQASKPSVVEKFPASLPPTNSGMSQQGASAKMPTHQHLLATQARKGRSNLSKSHQLNIVDSTSLTLQDSEDQEADLQQNILSKIDAGSLNSEGFTSLEEQAAKEAQSSDPLQMTNRPAGKESFIAPLSDASTVNPTATQRDLAAFGRSLKPNNFHQNYSLLNQMRSMKNTDNEPSNRVSKKLKGPDNILGGQQVAPWSGQPREHNNMMGDSSTCSTTVPNTDSEILSPSGPVDNVERIAPSKDTPSNNMISVKAEHSHISPQMAPSWFDQYGTFRNGQMLQRRVDTVKTMDKPFNIGGISGSRETHTSREQGRAAGNTSQFSVISKNPVPPSLAIEQFSSPTLPENAGIQNFVTLKRQKRKRATADLHPWLHEVLGGFRNLQGRCTAAVQWSRAANRLMEKVNDDGEVIEDVRPMPRPNKRIILTTHLMQQLFCPPPAAILSTDATSDFESVAFYAARLALGDACNLVASSRSYCSVSHGGENFVSDKSKQSESDHLSEVMGDYMSKARNLENNFFSLDKRASVLDLRLECQELEKFSIINRFARFHGRSQADGSETSLSDASANTQKPFPQRYVIAVPLPNNLPDKVQCLSL